MQRSHRILILTQVLMTLLLSLSFSARCEVYDLDSLKCENSSEVREQVLGMIKDEAETQKGFEDMVKSGLEYGLSEAESRAEAEKYYRDAFDFNKDQKASVILNYEECIESTPP